MAGAKGSELTMIPRSPQEQPMDAWIGRLALVLRLSEYVYIDFSFQISVFDVLEMVTMTG